MDLFGAGQKHPCPGSGELQAEAGGDKLVAVVSHLHAVAEAVEDVMCVERRPEGSSTRWLTAAERDDLGRGDVTSGLLTLV